MEILLNSADKELAISCRDVVRIFFPQADIKVEQPQGNLREDQKVIRVLAGREGNRVWCEAFFSSVDDYHNHAEEDTIHCSEEPHNALRRITKLSVKRLLEEVTEVYASPWGILTGIRPTKIVHRLLDKDWKIPDICNLLQQSYGLSLGKAELLLEVATRQRPFLLSAMSAKKNLSIYIGIPFCPTRCIYCSFPAYSLKDNSRFVEPFVNALIKEVTAIGREVKALGLKVDHLYIGGGTPTSLSLAQMASLLEACNKELAEGSFKEYTVEAGRPDTIDRDILSLFKASGVNRISINPQTMHKQTLKVLGRCHSPEDIIRAMELARQLNFPTINMDLIIGLPGETVSHVEESLKAIGKLKPENLTVHTLALKRASFLKEREADYPLSSGYIVGEMLKLTYQYTREMGLFPYYLYRQKQMLGQLENVGFAIPGHICQYNIQMMEERHTIIGLGGGSGSKWVNNKDWTLEATYNPKDPGTYIQRIDELIAKKVDKLKALS